jgi:uncharacterized protein (TIGR03083 family)
LRGPEVIGRAAGTFAGMLDHREYFEAIRRESERFSESLTSAESSAPVPTCPDWTADDLLWHLAEVQLFWAAIVRDRLADPDAAEAGKPERPDDRRALFALFGHATESLLEALATTPAATEVWTWGADQHVAFVSRWQAHEALMHRIDAELVTAAATALDARLASDGVDVALTIAYADLPSWSTFTPDGGTGLVTARDTGTAWSVALGRFTGTSPNTGKTYDQPTLVVVDTSPAVPSFSVRADAVDLDLWLWGRSDAARIEVEGDRDAFARLAEIVDGGIQ